MIAEAGSPYMQRALALAQSALGTTSPNPAVGAVLVKDGQVVGEGATQPPGGPHAEVVAIRAAGSNANGATLYVTLEPCCREGRTPPCVTAIRDAGIREVVVAMGDPDQQVSGRGVQALRDAGIAVRTGDACLQARRHYAAYARHRRTGHPFVIAKFAASLDGKIAASSGDSRWVSGPQTRAWAHRLRTEIDAILVGVGTILLDDPALTARPDGDAAGVVQPLRVVLDSRGRTPLTAQVLGDQETASTLVVTTSAAPPEWRAGIEAAGARLLLLPSEQGRVALAPLLDALGSEYGVVALLVEGGGQVHGSFFDAHLVDKVHAVIAPMIIGGDARMAVAGRGAERMREVTRLDDVSIERLGDDILMSGLTVYPPPGGAVVVRPAGAADAEGYRQLIEDPAQRLELEPAIQAAFDRALRDDGNVWVALRDEQVVGGVTLIHADPADSAAAQDAVAALDLLYVATEWQHAGLAARLVQTAEASAAGRAIRWLTSRVDPTRFGNWSEENWKQLGYRYYRRTPEGSLLLIKQLAEGGGAPPASAEADDAMKEASVHRDH